jgi:hypothetical protein
MAEEVLPAMCALADELELPRTTLGDYADFWIRREQLTPRVRVDSGTAHLVIDVPVADLPVRVDSSSSYRVTLNGTEAGRISAGCLMPV